MHWALLKGGLFFQNESEVQEALRRITVCLTPAGLRKVHEALEGTGYRVRYDELWKAVDMARRRQEADDWEQQG